MPSQQHGTAPSNPDGASVPPTAATEDATAVRPVSLRQGRGARLSFLGGLKKDQSSQHQQQLQQQYSPPPPVPQINGNHLANGHHQANNGDHHHNESHASQARGLGKDNPNRRSFFRSHPDQPKQSAVVVRVNGADGVGGGGGWAESDAEKAAAEEQAASKVGNVRRRLSLLKLGKKSSKGSGLMGSLEEE